MKRGPKIKPEAEKVISTVIWHKKKNIEKVLKVKMKAEKLYR
jgi:hypothetical protein